MGMHLIAAVELSGLLGTIVIIAEVALALGMVIFVHELGHFAVAKWCGVKCEKFYLGFDIYGLKLWKRQWGETEYGIGILPLGGYVKMLGQDDNPANAAEEMQRAKLQSDDPTAPVRLDPRSYLAKSVPQRMAIISAGVVMNVIFAFFTAMLAYGIGVDYIPCVVGGLTPGQPAWQKNLQPRDEIVQIANIEQPRFQDLKIGLALGDADHGVPLLIRRPGVEEPFWVTIHPDRDGLLPSIGIASTNTNRLIPEKPVAPGSPADRTEPALAAGDEIVAIDGQIVADSIDIRRELARHADQPVTIEVVRPGENDNQEAAERLSVVVDPNPMLTLGLVMKMGPVTAVQEDSPAAQAGIEPGDQLSLLDGEPIGDPLTWPDRLADLRGETVTLTVDRPGEDGPLELEVTLRDDVSGEWPSPALAEGLPVSVSELGVAYDVLQRVRDVAPDSPAAAAGIQPGDDLVSGQFLVPSETSEEPTVLPNRAIPFSKDEPNWPMFFFALQEQPVGTAVRLEVESSDSGTRTVDLTPVPASDWFNPERGFRLAPLMRPRQAGTVGEAASLALFETKEAVLQVYRFIQRVSSGALSPKLFGGPVSIATAAGYSAAKGVSELLLFLTMLSANLAVVNFLPIPLLDGGHMVLLLWEGIRGKPASEKVTIALHYAGFCFILSLMLFVISLDVSRMLQLEWVMQR